jgi:carbamoyl-phosphate synthase large subunit
MKSTGESMGIDSDFALAYAKAQLGANTPLPLSGRVFISVKDADKDAAAELAKDLADLGFTLIATRGTCAFLQEQGVAAEPINKVREGQPHIVDRMKDGDIQLVINTTEGNAAISDSFSIRRTALLGKIVYSTTIQGARCVVAAIAAIKAREEGLAVKPLQAYFG